MDTKNLTIALLASLAAGTALVFAVPSISRAASSVWNATFGQNVDNPNTGTQVMVDTSADSYTHFAGGPEAEGSSDNYVLSDRQISLGTKRTGGDAVTEEGRVQVNSFLYGDRQFEYGMDTINGPNQADNIRAVGKLGPNHDHYALHELPTVGLDIRDSTIRGDKKEFSSVSYPGQAFAQTQTENYGIGNGSSVVGNSFGQNVETIEVASKDQDFYGDVPVGTAAAYQLYKEFLS